MILRDDLISLINTYFGKELLAEAQQNDHFLANNIQIKGKEEINHILIGVSATVELFKKGIELHTNCILAKHPVYISAPHQIIDPSLQKRLRMIFQHNWTVGGYHYVLDVHPEIGNAALILKQLGATLKERIYFDWGYMGELSQPVSIAELKTSLEKILNHDAFVVMPEEEKPIKRIGVVTGRAVANAEDLLQMLPLNIDAYVTGEISEWAVHLFKEAGIPYFSCGHHATEVLAPKKFAEVLQSLVGNKARVEFVNIWNEI